MDANELATKYRMNVGVVGSTVENYFQRRHIRSSLTADPQSAIPLQQDVFGPQNNRTADVGNRQRCCSKKI